MGETKPKDNADEPEGTASDGRVEETQALAGAGVEHTAISTGAGSSANASEESETTSGTSHPQIRYFGAYELLHEIARGGMGVVYKARQTTLNRIVAVKMILGGQLASDHQVKRFLVEAEAAANLNHPGIVPVYEFGEHDDTHYFSMALVDGPSLAEKAAENPLDSDEAADLVRKVAEAVAFAHGRGVIHRDLKPANILIEHGEEPRITDFGLAKRIEDDSELTKTGAILGSVFYMSPEQADGRIEDTGTTSDVYSLGAILYKLLTGRPPFQAATVVETINQVVGHEPVPPRRLNPRIPKDLETICLKCLEKDASHRYNSADELADELRRFLEGQPIRARPIGRWAHLWRWCRRNPLPASLAAGLAVALLAGVFTATTLWNRANSERQRAQDQQHMVQVLSNMVLKKTLDETDQWLRLFFQPVERELMAARSWGENGLLDIDRPDELTALLGPLIEHYPQMSSTMVADDRGREHMLLGLEQQPVGTEPPTREWKSRLMRRDEWGDRVKWSQWSDRGPQPESSDAELRDYDPRSRPWYLGAIERLETVEPAPTNRGEAGIVHWTDPYVFFTTKDLGITASVAFDRDDGRDHVVAFDVLLRDITRFTTNKRPTPNGNLLVLTGEGELIGLPNVPQLQSPDEWKKAYLRKPSELGLAILADAAAQFSFTGDRSLQIRQFRNDGQSWWAGARPFRLGSAHVLWILVTVPESDLQYDLTTSDQGPTDH